MNSTQWEPRLTLPVSEDRDHIQGPSDAPVVLVEYGDFECPYCGAAYPIVKQIQDTMGPRLRFVFRNFPTAPEIGDRLLIVGGVETATSKNTSAEWGLINADVL